MDTGKCLLTVVYFQIHCKNVLTEVAKQHMHRILSQRVVIPIFWLLLIIFLGNLAVYCVSTTRCLPLRTILPDRRLGAAASGASQDLRMERDERETRIRQIQHFSISISASWSKVSMLDASQPGSLATGRPSAESRQKRNHNSVGVLFENYPI